MAVQVKALRRVYMAGERKEYLAGQVFTITDEREADRLARRSKVELLGAAENISRQTNQKQQQEDDLSALRTEYREVVGKAPFHGWGPQALREKISAYRTTNMGDSNFTTHLTAPE